MYNQLKFLIKLGREFMKNELYYLGNELTYKMVLSVFPLIIFLLNISVMLNIQQDIIFSLGEGTIPDEVMRILTMFLNNVENSTNQDNITGNLSWSLIITIGSAASGFRSIIRGINKTYRIKEQRRFIYRWLLAIVLVLQFVAIIVIAATTLVFGDVIINFLKSYGFFNNASGDILSFAIYLTTVFIMLIDVMIIYKVSVEYKIKLISTLPGATVTVIFWIISSKLFNIYVNNFSNYNNIYGGIGSLFIFIFWINIIAIVLLLGSQINALIEMEYRKNKKD